MLVPRRRKTQAHPDLAVLLPSWILALRAERKSPHTVASYGNGVRALLAWCAREGVPAILDRPTLQAFTAATLEAGLEATTATARHLACRRYSAWLAEEGEIPADEIAHLRAPKLDAKVVEPLTEDQLRALIRACVGKTLRDRRDEAIVRLMAETGARAGEIAVMDVTDVDLPAGTAVIRRGKGGKGRLVPFGPQTARAIDRYLRLRRAHRLADSPALWLGDRGKPFGYDGLYKSILHRAERAGIDGMYPHRLRHTFADRWLSADGSEGALMTVAGWSPLLPYTRARAAARPPEARRLNLGDL
jgi:site-specific recombinase XerD